jgi:hypothetical protein
LSERFARREVELIVRELNLTMAMDYPTLPRLEWSAFPDTGQASPALAFDLHVSGNNHETDRKGYYKTVLSNDIKKREESGHDWKIGQENNPKIRKLECRAERREGTTHRNVGESETV